MSKYTRNVGKLWRDQDLRELLEYYFIDQAPVRIIALKLARTESSIRGKVSSLKRKRKLSAY